MPPKCLEDLCSDETLRHLQCITLPMIRNSDIRSDCADMIKGERFDL